MTNVVRLAPLGFPLEIRSDDPRPPVWMARLFGQEDADSGAPAIVIDIRVAPSGPAAPREPAPRPSYDLGDDGLRCSLGDSVCEGSWQDLHFRIRLSEADLERPGPVTKCLLATPVFASLDRLGAAGFHAACLALPGDGAILVRAGSGGGKSTLSLAWQLLGGTVLADEVGWIAPGGRVAGFSEEIEIRPDAARFFPGLPFVPVVTLSGEEKLQFAAGGGAAGRGRRLAAVVLLDRREGEPAGVESMEAADLLAALAETAIPEERDFRRRLALLAPLLAPVGGAGSLRLRTGGDPLDGARRLAAAFGGSGDCAADRPVR